jgi:hypothetical protein
VANKVVDEADHSTRRQTRRARVQDGDKRHVTQGCGHDCPEYEAVADSASHKAADKTADSIATPAVEY